MTFPKDGRFASKVFLAFAARQDCAGGGEQTLCDGRITVHHFPPKGMGGASKRDDRVVALCVRHHDDAQCYRIPKFVQAAWVDELRSRFMEQATATEMDAFVRDWKRWRDGRVFEEVPA